ncbi:2-oxo acid dehydrogenase subunit E2 [Amycolatopsis rubida]|uniref:Dihydrolipoamide acetyltransferase component of pyruvate dehydrogenase complex n=1 Tax=Amycolatopsis rubida TaxID=112413 RepID=A0ABX0C235_9PSEU|nr:MULTISPECIES: dihydrolipoamide acetyltransferase family protein [Amycolatopsis]MYW96741.1 2-oxo acid dehydrogenase subunit E2 [Amycolatopsis rubida]NEC61726.1 2-oxo acid dehydrogenase subunit E2 [Amycolatopsis rubida]OAP25787.1 Branched-chain alpha-ketoacid dehydrogenase complex component E2 [Amycolatopsis sp. M39]
MAVFKLPDLGEGLTEAEIVAWHVAVGDTVTVDQTVVEVETAKASVEVPVPFAGRVATLHGAAGEVLAVGSPLITVDSAADFTEPGVVTPEGSGNVLIGYGTSQTRTRRARRSRGSKAPAAAPAPAPKSASDRIRVVSPLVRRLARESGVDLHALTGTGTGGIVSRADVERAIAAAETPAVPASDEQRIPLRGLRKTVADKLARSRREIPEATVWVDVDATELLQLRTALNSDPHASKISLLALVGRFAVAGLRRFPELNAHLEGDEIVIPSAVHLGFAAQTDRGLVVPVVQNAHQHTLEDLSAALADRTEQARAGRLAPADLTGGTFTVNNYGVFGVDGSAAIINYPEVAILGVGRIIDRPWIVDGQVTARKITELTLAFDHRVCDGATAGGFLRFVADCIENPVRLLRTL